MRKTFGFLGGVGQYPLALITQRKVHRGRDLLPDGGVPLDLFADGFDRGMGAQEAVGERLVFPQQPQQQVLRLNVRRAELAGLVTRKEDDAPGFLRIAFEHNALPLTFPAEPPSARPTEPEPLVYSYLDEHQPVPYIMQSNGLETQAGNDFLTPCTLPKELFKPFLHKLLRGSFSFTFTH